MYGGCVLSPHSLLSLDNGVTMTPKRRAINLSWFFIEIYVMRDPERKRYIVMHGG